MRRKPTSSILPWLVLAALTLSACGIRGDLKTPPPVWGEPTTQMPPADTPANIRG